jgi:hypothetical protein
MKMPDPHFKLVETITGARTYYFRSTERLGGWAFCTVDDKTAQLMIMSDWGNWSHMWDPKALGCPSLTHFIANRGCDDYLANKLLGRDEAWVIDADVTIKKWRKQLCAQRLAEGREGSDDPPYYLPRERRLDAHRAREIWHSLGSLFDDERDESIFIEHALQIEGFTRWITSEPWEQIQHDYSPQYRLLVDFLLPALAAACRETTRSQVA